MVISNRFPTMTKVSLALLATVAATSIASQAFAASAYSSDGAASLRVVQKHKAPSVGKNPRKAFGMVGATSSRLDPNSPEAAGGGSLGYNRKLLEY